MTFCTLSRRFCGIKKTQVTGQDVGVPPSISIHEYELEAVHEFAYLGPTITDSHSLETELNRRIGKAVTSLQADKKSLDKQQAHRALTKTGVQGLCGEHPSVRQRILCGDCEVDVDGECDDDNDADVGGDDTDVGGGCDADVK